MKIVVIDVESTGLPKKGAKYDIDYLDFPRIVSVAWKVNDMETKYFIINQEGFKISPEATAIHGITNEMCKASPHKLYDVLLQIKEDCDYLDVVVGHNLYFDTSLLKANILRLIHEKKTVRECFEFFTKLFHKDKRIDTMYKTIKFCALPGYKWAKLTELYFKLFNSEFNAHNCKDDVEATHKCFHELVKLGVIVLPEEEEFVSLSQ